MRWTLVVATLLIGACTPERGDRSSSAMEAYDGARVVLTSRQGTVVALFPDAGVYRNYGSISEVGGQSDIGGVLKPCDHSIGQCVSFSGLYVMVPPEGQPNWFFGGYDFRQMADPADRDSVTVQVSRYGDDAYSYRFSTTCGVRWINFSSGGAHGREIFHTEGNALFQTTQCRSIQGQG